MRGGVGLHWVALQQDLFPRVFRTRHRRRSAEGLVCIKPLGRAAQHDFNPTSVCKPLQKLRDSSVCHKTPDPSFLPRQADGAGDATLRAVTAGTLRAGVRVPFAVRRGLPEPPGAGRQKLRLQIHSDCTNVGGRHVYGGCDMRYAGTYISGSSVLAHLGHEEPQRLQNSKYFRSP